jgi:hypothetical protein
MKHAYLHDGLKGLNGTTRYPARRWKVVMLQTT